MWHPKTKKGQVSSWVMGGWYYVLEKKLTRWLKKLVFFFSFSFFSFFSKNLFNGVFFQLNALVVRSKVKLKKIFFCLSWKQKKDDPLYYNIELYFKISMKMSHTIGTLATSILIILFFKMSQICMRKNQWPKFSWH